MLTNAITRDTLILNLNDYITLNKYKEIIMTIAMTGKVIKQRREAQGLSREALAAKMDVALYTIYRWETNKAKPHKIFQKMLNDILN